MLLTFGANAAQLKPYVLMQRSNSSRKRCSASSAPLSPLWSSDEAAVSSTTPDTLMSARPWHLKALSAINESTKWTVSATVLAVLLWQHNEYAAWCVMGAVLSSFLCKVLKHVLNHERPDNAPKTDPGMPSSHANSLNFLSVYAALSMAYHTNNNAGALALAAAALCLGMFKTWLRVFLGFHTWPQVLVGAGLGAATAVSWFKLGTAWVLPALQQSAAGLAALYAVTGLGSAAFGVKIISSWWKEQQQRQPPQQQCLQQAVGSGPQQSRHYVQDDQQERLLQQPVGTSGSTMQLAEVQAANGTPCSQPGSTAAVVL